MRIDNKEFLKNDKEATEIRNNKITLVKERKLELLNTTNTLKKEIKDREGGDIMNE